MLLLRPQLLRDVLNGRPLVDTSFLTRHRAWREASRMARAVGRWLAGKNYGGAPVLLPPPPARVARVAGPGARPLWRRGEDPGGGSAPPEAGKPAPLRPRPGHHLVAARALPPGDATFLLPKD